MTKAAFTPTLLELGIPMVLSGHAALASVLTDYALSKGNVAGAIGQDEVNQKATFLLALTLDAIVRCAQVSVTTH